MSKGKKIIVGIVMTCIFAVVFAGVSYYSFIYYSYKKTSYVENDKNKNSIEINYTNNKQNSASSKSNDDEKNNKKNESDLKFKEVEGITNILLVGTDGREYAKNSRSDTIMILTIDDIHKKIKLTSIMRDTYVSIPGYGEQKINHSFVYGQIPLLMNTIEKNFDVKLDKYVIVNFMGFKNLVDALGGLDINVTEQEREELNRCIIGLENYKKNFFGEEPHFLKNSGLQHLDGQQVLAYARMRHIENACYSRDERQRKVVSMIAEKLKGTSILKYPDVVSKLLPCVKTNLEFSEAINLGYTAYKIGNFDIKQLQIPATKLSYGLIYKNKGWVLLMDKAQNINILHDFIFKDILYNPSNYKQFDYAKSEYYYKPKNNDDNKKVANNTTNSSESKNVNKENENIIKESSKNNSKDDSENVDVFDLDDEEFYTDGVQDNNSKNDVNNKKDESES